MYIKYVYVVSHPDTNEVVYVGCSQDVESRARNHALTISGPLYTWVNKLLKEGKYPIFTIVERTEGYAYRASEDEWILKYYNEGAPLLNRRIPGVKKKSKQVCVIVNTLSQD